MEDNRPPESLQDFLFVKGRGATSNQLSKLRSDFCKQSKSSSLLESPISLCYVSYVCPREEVDFFTAFERRQRGCLFGDGRDSVGGGGRSEAETRSVNV